MSLLMDALKKAELAKRQAPQDKAEPSSSTSPQEPLELAPLGAPVEPFGNEQSLPSSVVDTQPAKGTLPELPSTLELLDQEFMDEALALAKRKPETSPEPGPAKAATLTTPPTFVQPSGSLTGSPPAATTSASLRAPPAEAQRERDSVKNVFEAKQAAAPSRKTFAIVIGLVSLFAAAAIGIYVWLQLQPKSSLLPAKPIGMPASMASHPIVAPPPPTPEPQPAVAAPPPPPEEEQTEEPPAAAVRQQVAQPENPIHVTKSQLRVDPSTDTAFNALQSGNLAAAQAGYEQSLKNDPKNADALHGLATVQLRLGKPELAQDLYLRALEADPKDALAQASLISMTSQIDPLQSESRLKLLLAAQPDSPFLNFYLGNVYARQNRWADAQQNYFKAMAAEPENPDYLFNLAVSLDQLHQAKLAAQYYAQALAAGEKRPAGFDRQQVSDRLKKLQP